VEVEEDTSHQEEEEVVEEDSLPGEAVHHQGEEVEIPFPSEEACHRDNSFQEQGRVAVLRLEEDRMMTTRRQKPFLGEGEVPSMLVRVVGAQELVE
jgi:hypothetical protein